MLKSIGEKNPTQIQKKKNQYTAELKIYKM